MGKAPPASHDASGGRGRDGRRRREQPLRPGTVTPERQRMCQYLVALAQLGYAGADRCDRPGRLRPERHGSRAADLPAADPDKVVPGADAGGNDVDEDLACGRRPKLVQLEDLDRPAECCDPSRSHPARRTLLASVMRRAPLWHLARGVRREQVTDAFAGRACGNVTRAPARSGDDPAATPLADDIESARPFVTLRSSLQR